MFKTCTRCHRRFPANADHFALDPRNRSGLAADCRDCRHRTVRENKARLRLQRKLPCPGCGQPMNPRVKLCPQCRTHVAPETCCQAARCKLPRKHADARGCGLHWPSFDHVDLMPIEFYATQGFGGWQL